MALAIDVSSASTNTSAGAAAFNTANFTTAQAGELIVVLVSLCDIAAGGTNTLSSVVSGAGLTWTMRVRRNGNGNHVSEIWTAVASGVLTAQHVTVTPAGTINTVSYAVHVLSFTGADTVNPIGASNSSTNPNGTTASPSLTLATTAGSYCVAAGADYWTNATISAGSGQTLLATNQDVANGEVEWTQRTTSTTSTSQTMSASGTGSDGWVFVAAEIKAASATFTWQQLTDPSAALPRDLWTNPEVVGY